MSITYTQTSDGFFVKVPYHLKDIFKSVFKTAKWNADRKEWKVGVRAKNKLDQLIKETSEQVKIINELIDESESILLTDKELSELKDNLQSKIEECKEELQQSKQLTINIEKNKKIINQLKEILETTEKQIIEEKQTQEKEFEEIKEKINKIIDIEKILNAKQEMIYTYKHHGSSAKNRYNYAQEQISEEINKLEKVGLKSSGLNRLYYFNFNRPDRDNPNSVEITDIYDIYKI